MSIEISPVELGFQRPFTQEVTQVLRLRNPTHEPIAFKVKTTAPKQYCVRPNSGRIEVGQEVEVYVLLQAMKEDPPLDAKCRDKFLVQSVAISADRDMANITSLWQYVEQHHKTEIKERKIRVSFLPIEGTSTTPMHNHLNGNHFNDTPSSEPLAYSSPSPEAMTPSRVPPIGPVSVPDSRPANNRHLGDALASAYNPAMSSSEQHQQERQAPETSTTTLSSAVNAVTNAVPTSMDDLRAQLAEAKETISRLTRQTQDQILRQRKTEAVAQDSRERVATGTTGMGIQQAVAEGVPVQIVAGLCLLSFLLAYLLF